MRTSMCLPMRGGGLNWPKTHLPTSFLNPNKTTKFQPFGPILGTQSRLLQDPPPLGLPCVTPRYALVYPSPLPKDHQNITSDWDLWTSLGVAEGAGMAGKLKVLLQAVNCKRLWGKNQQKDAQREIAKVMKNKR